MQIATERLRLLNDHNYQAGPIVYWMSRDQRVQDNWALLYAQYLANTYKQPLIVIFNLVPTFQEATWRQYSFMFEGLQEVEAELKALNIPFHLLLGIPGETIPQFIKNYQVGVLVSDFSPLRIYKHWKAEINKKITIPFYEVDTHNIVPCWHASPKQEFGAYTLRPKLNRLLDNFLTEIPSILPHSYNTSATNNVDWAQAKASLQINTEVQPVDWCIPGAKAGKLQLAKFIEEKLSLYDTGRNDPNQQAQSDLSPYLHFGQLSAQYVAWTIKASDFPEETKAAFLEELIVRRELADNFCFYNANYDSFSGFPAWAQLTLNEHRADPRPHIYSLSQFESAQTHDPLWNAAQRQMVRTGKMHGFMRMYWAKKILEWTASPEEAQAIAIKLNDIYELDGRDPSGYVGIAWSIGGVHDRAWFSKPVFGKVRYMNANGCARKFNVQQYIDQYA